jgi:hypothetical protein
MKVLISESNLTKIANAIRSRLGVEDRYTPNNMGATIQDNLMRIPSNGTFETYMAADTVYGRVQGGNFVERFAEGNTNPVNKINDINVHPYLICMVKLSSNKVLVLWVTTLNVNSRITAVVCTINDNNSVTVGNSIILPVEGVLAFHATLLTESTVIVGSLSNSMNITVLGIENTTITTLKNKTFNETQGYKVIKVAKKDNTHFITVVGKDDGTVGMCMAMNNNGEPQKYGNVLNAGGVHTGADTKGNSIDVLVLNGNTCVIVKSSPTGQGNVAGLTIIKCTIDDNGITETDTVSSSSTYPIYGQAQVSAQLIRDDRAHKDDRIFILGGGSNLHLTFAVVCKVNPTLGFLKVIPEPLFNDTTSYSSVSAIATYENCILCSLGGSFLNPQQVKTKVMLIKVGLDNNLTQLITKEYAGVCGNVPVERLEGSKMFITGAIPGIDQQPLYVGTSVFNFTYGVREMLHGNFYGIATNPAINGEETKVCIPPEVIQ